MMNRQKAAVKKRFIFCRRLAASVLLMLAAFGCPQGLRAEPLRIVDEWPAHAAWLILLGVNAREIIAAAANPSQAPWLFHLEPDLAGALRLRGAETEKEALYRLHPSVVFLPRARAIGAESWQALKIPACIVSFSRFEEIPAMLRRTETCLGGVSPKNAGRKEEYLRQLSRALDKGPFFGRRRIAPPSVLHIASLFPLRVDGLETIIQDWIEKSGGRNAAVITGNARPVSWEQILHWNPDIIIVSAAAGGKKALEQIPEAKTLAALRNGKVYTNPSGLFLWDRYGPELLLQIPWAREITGGETPKEALWIKRIRAFYRQFYQISLKDSDARRIMHGVGPEIILGQKS